MTGFIGVTSLRMGLQTFRILGKIKILVRKVLKMERFAVKKLLPRILKVTKIGSIIGKRIYYIGVGGSFEASHT